MSKDELLVIKVGDAFIFSGIAESMYGIVQKNVSFKIGDKEMIIEARGEGNSVLFRTVLWKQKFIEYTLNKGKDQTMFYLEIDVGHFRNAFKDTKKKVTANITVRKANPNIIRVARKTSGKETIPLVKIPIADDSEPVEYKYPDFDESNPIVSISSSEFDDALKAIKKTKCENTRVIISERFVKIKTTKVKGLLAQSFPFGDQEKPGKKLIERKIPTKTLLNIMKCSKLHKMLRIYIASETDTIIFSIDAASGGIHYVYLPTKKK